MIATAFLLFVFGAGDMPTLTALAAFEDEASCTAAAQGVTAALATGASAQTVACLPSEALAALGSAVSAPTN